MEYFVREVARPGPVSSFDFTALLTKVASNVLMTCEHLRRYLKVSWSMLSIFDFFQIQILLNGGCEVPVEWSGWVLGYVGLSEQEISLMPTAGVARLSSHIQKIAGKLVCMIFAHV